MPMDLMKMDRHQIRNANKMQLQKYLKDEMAEKLMKPL
jgi:hypothetical protein